MFVLFYDYVEDILERRTPHREAHLGMLRDTPDLFMAGALGDPPRGALFVFRSAEAAEAFAGADPYGKAGLVTSRRIEPWNVVIGPSSPD